MSLSALNLALVLASSPPDLDCNPSGIVLESDAPSSVYQNNPLLASPATITIYDVWTPLNAIDAKEQLSDISSPPILSSRSDAPTQLASPASTAAFEPQSTIDPTNLTAPQDVGQTEAEQDDSNTIIVTARPRAPKIDPLQELNVDSFEVIQGVDEAIVGPVALHYKETIPEPVRDGLRNFISNLGEPVVFLNYLLQLKPGKAVETLGRFALNTTVGIGGLIDVAKRPPFNLPNRSNGFANTLGYYGVKPGPFLFLPLVGPTTLRDVFGGGLDLLVLPFSVGKPFNQLTYTLPGSIISSLDSRAEYDQQLVKLREESGDFYTATRAFYLQKRQNEINELRGIMPQETEPNPIIITPEDSTISPPRTPLLDYQLNYECL